jgi:hypothetical protein
MGAGRATVALADLGDALELAGQEPVRGPDAGRDKWGRLDRREARSHTPATPARGRGSASRGWR